MQINPSVESTWPQKLIRQSARLQQFAATGRQENETLVSIDLEAAIPL